jgi:hypothetical protein
LLYQLSYRVQTGKVLGRKHGDQWGASIVTTVRMNRAIEAFEREFAPWALKLPAADVAARRGGQLRANGWSVLYAFGHDAYGEYLDYYAALREATDARVNDDWHARIYATGQIVAFPAVLEAYLYARDPSPDELERARAPVLASLEPPPEEAAAIGTADTALWEDLKDVVEAETPAPPPVVAAPPAPVPEVKAPPEKRVSVPVRRSAETPAEIANVLDAAFGGATHVHEAPATEPEVAAKEVAEPEVAEPEVAEPEVAEKEDVVEEIPPAPPAPRRSAPGYDPFIELRANEPKSMRHAAPTNDDFRPYWQRYPARTAGIAGGVAAVLLLMILVMGHSSSGKKRPRTLADTTTTAAATPAAADTTSGPTATPEDSQTVVSPPADTADTASAPVTPTSTATPPSSSSEESSVARPIGPGSVPKIVRVDGSGSSPSASHQFARPSTP